MDTVRGETDEWEGRGITRGLRGEDDWQEVAVVRRHREPCSSGNKR